MSDIPLLEGRESEEGRSGEGYCPPASCLPTLCSESIGVGSRVNNLSWATVHRSLALISVSLTERVGQDEHQGPAGGVQELDASGRRRAPGAQGRRGCSLGGGKPPQPRTPAPSALRSACQSRQQVHNNSGALQPVACSVAVASWVGLALWEPRHLFILSPPSHRHASKFQVQDFGEVRDVTCPCKEGLLGPAVPCTPRYAYRAFAAAARACRRP